MKNIRIAMAAMAAAAATAGSADAAQGLNGRYFDVLAAGNNSGNQAYADANTPYATFTAHSVCFPSCVVGSSIDDGTNLSTFLGVGSGYVSGLSQDDQPISNHILTLSGFLNIQTAGFYNFLLNSDDGSRLRINGTTVVDNDFAHGPLTVTGGILLTAGYHAIDILQWEAQGGTNLQAQIAFGDGPFQTLGGDFLATALPTTPPGVPEPATWAVMILGFGAAGSMLRRRRTSVAAA